MARTKQTARKSTGGSLPGTRPDMPSRFPPPSGLLKLLGVPENGTTSLSSMASVPIDWTAVAERLVSHPEEAKIPVERNYSPDVVIDGVAASHMTHYNAHMRVFPLSLAMANTNERSPIPPSALEAFIKAFPDVVTNHRSTYLHLQKSASRSEIGSVLRRHNPYICGEERTRTFVMMGCPASNREEFPRMFYYRDHTQDRANHIDWPAIERHLRDHPHEAKIPCHCGTFPPGPHDFGRFPLEIAVQFEHPPVPLSTVRLLLELAPEAVADPQSCALTFACTFKPSFDPRFDPGVARAILRANPDLAASVCAYEDVRFEEQQGFPLHGVAYFMKDCGADLAAELLAAHPAAIGSRNSIYDETPLEIACRESYRRKLSTEFLRTLLEAGHRYLLNGDGETRQQLGAGELEKGQMLYNNGYTDEGPLTELARLWLDDDLWQIWDNHNLGIPTTFEFVPGVERLRTDWDNYCLGLRAAGAYEARLPAERMWEYPLLQAAIRFATRLWTVATVVRFHCAEDDLIRPDPTGHTPLLAAIDRAIDGPGNPEDPDHDDDEFSCPAVLDLLLDKARVSSHASADANGGGFRLHRALRKGIGLDDGTRHIANAFPRALSIPDPQTGLIPCLLAAVGEAARVETIFELMVRRPDLLAVLCTVGEESNLLNATGAKRNMDDGAMDH